MKELYFLLMAALFTLNSSAQTITAFTLIPTNPTTADSITIHIQFDFPQSPCDGETFPPDVVGNEIQAGSLHCMGNTPTPCTDFDTIVIPPLPAGQYSLYLLLTTGTTAGCIVGILPFVFDSTQIIVSPPTHINELNQNSLQIIPNPSNGKFIVKHDIGENSLLNIYAVDGRIIHSFVTTGNESDVDVTLPQGIYAITIQNTKRKWFSKLVMK